MTTLKPHDLDRLLRSHRRSMISLVTTVLVIIVGVAVLIMADLPLPFAGALGPVLGMGIGTLILIPQRRLLNELGISNVQAREILQAERERRSGVATLPPKERATRDLLRAWIFLIAGLILVVVFLVAASYLFRQAGRTVEEDAPTDPWFATSAFVGFFAFAVGPTLLMTASHYRKSASSWRRMDGGPVGSPH